MLVAPEPYTASGAPAPVHEIEAVPLAAAPVPDASTVVAAQQQGDTWWTAGWMHCVGHLL